MSKELEMVRAMINGANEYEKKTGDKNPPVYFSKNNLLIIEKALERLESIDNANPSEALECLEKIIDNLDDYADFEIKQEANEYIDAIKQALKAQEPKQYLKWEDLEFKIENQEMFVLLNGSYYLLEYYTDSETEYVMIKTTNTTMFAFEGDWLDDIQFFNDLHLERVEE